jgi:hypothetical protein
MSAAAPANLVIPFNRPFLLRGDIIRYDSASADFFVRRSGVYKIEFQYLLTTAPGAIPSIVEIIDVSNPTSPNQLGVLGLTPSTTGNVTKVTKTIWLPANRAIKFVWVPGLVAGEAASLSDIIVTIQREG